MIIVPFTEEEMIFFLKLREANVLAVRNGKVVLSFNEGILMDIKGEVVMYKRKKISPPSSIDKNSI